MNHCKLLIFLGISLLILVPIWLTHIHLELESLDDSFYMYEEQIGINSLVPEYGAQLPEPFSHHNVHEIKVLEEIGDELMVESRLIAKNLDDDSIFLDETRVFTIDKRTKSHMAVEKGYLVFPNHVEKRDYLLTFPLAFTQAVFSFVQETQIQGLDVYEFHCESEPYDITNAIAHFAGYEVKSFYTCKIWIEPLSGKHVAFELDWKSYYEETGKLTLTAEMGNKKTTPEFVDQLIIQAKQEKSRLVFIHSYFPIILIVSGIVSLIYGYNSYLKLNQELRREIKQKTDELVSSEKMFVLGELASRFAHDVRNPLTVIKGTFDLMKENKNLSKKDILRLDSVDEAINRITHQIDDVLDYVRKKPMHFSRNSFSDIFNSAKLDVIIPPGIKLVEPKTDVVFSCDFSNMRVVLVNLLLNAVQAIGESGRILVDVTETKDKISIIVQDSGSGILAKNKEKIFEPLFTTKQEGTGLGLSGCKTILEQHKGTISVLTNPTTFTVSLPKE